MRKGSERNSSLLDSLFNEGEDSLRLFAALSASLEPVLGCAILAAEGGATDPTYYRGMGEVVALMRRLQEKLHEVELPSPVEITVSDLDEPELSETKKKHSIAFSIKGFTGLKVLIEAYYSNGQRVRSIHGTTFTFGENNKTNHPTWLTLDETQASITFSSRSCAEAVTVIVTTSFNEVLHQSQALNWEFKS
jgi:hypothetical protein